MKRLKSVETDQFCLEVAECDCDGIMWVTPGTRSVNLMGYILTKRPWEAGAKDYIWG